MESMPYDYVFHGQGDTVMLDAGPELELPSSNSLEVNEEKRDVEPGPVLGKLKRQVADHFKHWKGGEKNLVDLLPADHNIAHFPADDRCPFCEAAEMGKAPSFADESKQGQAHLVNKALWLIHLDLLTVRSRDIYINKY